MKGITSSCFTWILFLIIALHMIQGTNSQSACKAKAQGKHFIVVFPENYQQANSLHITIVSFQDRITEVNISSPHRLSSNSYFMKTVLVQPMSYERVIIPDEFELFGTERSNKTIEIMADFEISVHTFHLESYSSDGYLSIPTDSLGTQYVVVSNEEHPNGFKGLFAIYGVLNDTTVTIKLNAAITFEGNTYTRGDILTLYVSRLEAVQITSSGDLTGSIISSDKPIGVINGHSCFNTPSSACDVLLEQSVPVSNWGTRHFYSATGVQTGTSKYRMVAFYNDTSFIVNSNNITLDSGEFTEFDIPGNGVIYSTKPASLIQILTRISGSAVDPSLIQVPTENQFTLMLGFTTPTHSAANPNGFNNYVNIIVKTDRRYSLRLNGSQITNTNPSLLPYVVHEGNMLGSDYDLIVVRLPREEDAYFITQEPTDDSPMSAIVYGYESSESYGYVAGLSLPVLPPSPPSLLSSINSFNPSTCSSDIVLTWMTPPSDRTVDRYFLYLDGSPLANTTSNNYTHSTILNISTDYQYSLTASSCIGNSSISSSSSLIITSYSFSMATHSTCLVYNRYTGGLTINWNLTQPTQASGVSGLELTYSLLLLYSHRRQSVTYTYTNSTSFTLPSSLLSYYTVLTAHNFTQLDAVETNITASLRIVQQCGMSSVGPEFNCSFRSAPPATPQTVTTEALSPTSIRVRWLPPPGIDQNGPITMYNISYTGQLFDTNIQFVYFNVNNIIYPAVDPVYFNITGLEEYNNYTISVSAINAEGASGFSPGVIQITDIAAPAATPQTVTTEALSPTSIRVRWLPPPGIDQNGPITMYNISYTGQLFDTNIQFVYFNVTNIIYPAVDPVYFNITGLEEYNNYTISVSANTMEGASVFAAGVMDITNIAVPAATPQTVTTEALSPTSIRVRWVPPPGIDQNGPITMYNISYTGLLYDTSTQYVSVSVTKPIYPAAAAIYTNITGLEEYNNYTISVSAINTEGASGFSPAVMQQTFISAPTAAPQTVTTEALSPTSIRVRWVPPPGIYQNGLITMYNISYTGLLYDTSTQYVSVSVFKPIYPAAAAIYTNITGLEEYNNYTIGVSAINAEGASGFSTGVIQITNIAAPIASPTTFVQNFTSTDVIIQISPPLQVGQNGPLIIYEIQIETSEFEIATEKRSFSIPTSMYPLSTHFNFNASGLQEFVDYNISVRVFTSAGPGPFSAVVEQRTNAAAPGQSPLNVTVSTINATRLTVCFHPPTGIYQNGVITAFDISYRGILLDTSLQITRLDVTSTVYPLSGRMCVILTNLAEFSNYSVSVVAINSGGTGPTSVDVVQITDEAAPTAPPQNFTVSNATGNVTLSWIPPPPVDQNGIITFYLYSYIGIERDQILRSATVPGSITSVQSVSGLDAFTTYMFWISARTIIGIGPESDPVSIMTGPEPPSRSPMNITVSTINSTAVNITWRLPPVDDHNGILLDVQILYEGVDLDTNQIIVNLPITSTNDVSVEYLILSNLQEYVNYSIRLRISNVEGFSPLSDSIFERTSAAAPIAAPQTVTTYALSPTSIRVRWVPPPGIYQNGPITMYNISYTGLLYDTSTQYISVSITSPIYPAAAAIYTNITGLEEYNNYTISVSAVNAEGASGFSLGVIQPTLISAPAATPQTVTTEALSPTSIRVRWVPPPGIDQNGPITMYSISYTGLLYDTSTQYISVSITSPIYPAAAAIYTNITGLEEYNNYTISVSAVNAEGASGFSPAVMQQTFISVPTAAPQTVTTEALSPTSIRVRWVPPPGIDQNGLITMYNISYTGLLYDTSTQYVFVNVFKPIYPAATAIYTNITGLEEYNNYTIRVSAVNAEGASGFSNGVIQITNIAAPIASPTTFVQSFTSTDIVVQISPPLQVGQNGPLIIYEIQIETSEFEIATENRSFAIPTSMYPLSSNFNFNASGLQEFVDYNISVRAFTSAGPGPFSAVVEQRTNAAAPGQSPLNVTVSTINATRLTVCFRPPTGIYQNGVITAFDISYRGILLDTSLQTKRLDVTSTAYPLSGRMCVILTNLEEFSNYSVSVVAINSGGPGPASVDEVQITDEAAPAAPPQNFIVSNATGNVTLSWSPPPLVDQNGIIAFYLYSIIGIERDQILRSATVPGSITSVQSVSGLDAFTTYMFWISARTIIGIGPESDPVSIMTGPEPPSRPPMNITVSTINSTALNITWRLPSVDDHNGILLDVQILYEGVDLDTNQIIVNLPITNTNDASVEYLILSNLQEYVNYSISLRISNVEGFSPLSDPIFERTAASAPIAVPQTVTTDALSPTSIRVRWVPPPGIDQNGPITMYNISYTGLLYDTSTQYVSVSITSPIYPAAAAIYTNITGLEEYNNYTIRVSAINAEGAGGFSPGVIEITNIGPPLITLNNGSNSSFSLLPPNVNSAYVTVLTQNVVLSTNLVGRWQRPDNSYVASNTITFSTFYVTQGGVYKFYVDNLDGQQTLAIQIDIELDGTYEQQITNLQTEKTSSTSILLTWTLLYDQTSNSNETFSIYYSIGELEMLAGQTDSLMYEISDLVPDVNYEYRIEMTFAFSLETFSVQIFHVPSTPITTQSPSDPKFITSLHLAYIAIGIFALILILFILSFCFNIILCWRMVRIRRHNIKNEKEVEYNQTSKMKKGTGESLNPATEYNNFGFGSLIKSFTTLNPIFTQLEVTEDVITEFPEMEMIEGFINNPLYDEHAC